MLVISSFRPCIAIAMASKFESGKGTLVNLRLTAAPAIVW